MSDEPITDTRKSVKPNPEGGLPFEQAVDLTFEMHGDAIKELAFTRCTAKQDTQFAFVMGVVEELGYRAVTVHPRDGSLALRVLDVWDNTQGIIRLGGDFIELAKELAELDDSIYTWENI